MSDAAQSFDKILVARFSPKNGCAGPAGEWLVPAGPAETIGKVTTSHRFVSIRGRHVNKFGWVSQTAVPFTAKDLEGMDSNGLRGKLGDDASVVLPPTGWYESYLKAVERLSVDTAMGCDWREVNLPGVQRRELWVHMVRFYEG